MCVIIIKQKGKDVPREVLKTSARINPHGLGIVWLDTFKVSYHKSSEYSLLNTARPYIAHFRYATVGRVCRENTHPFVCGNNKDELFMMNGTVKGYGNENMTDTEDLAIQLGKTPRHTWKKSLSKFDARFVAINIRNRTFQIFNKHLYTYRGGVWYSKANVLQDNVVAVYGTLKKGFHNNHAYLSNSKFLGKGYTKDKYPLVVSGLPYLIDKKGKGTNVRVDVFKVDDKTFKDLDLLEGHPRWYRRRQIPINVNNKVINAWIYFNPTESHLWDGHNHVKSYERTYNLSPSYTYNVVKEPRCTQIENYNEFPDEESPICVECFHDLEYDGFSNYHCNGCDGWFTEEQVLRLS